MYHCTEPVPVEPDWGIALRVSKEAEGGGDGGEKGDMGGTGKARGKEAVTGAAPEQREQEVLTPPLLVPLESGDAYFLLDDFK